MSNVPQRWHLPTLLVFEFVGGPLALFNGLRGIDRGSTLSVLGGWFMVVGGVVLMLGGALALLGLVRGKRSK